MCSRFPPHLHALSYIHTYMSSVICRFTQCKVRGECMQPFPPHLHALAYPCIALQCCLLPQQLHSIIRGFNSGVCHVMNSTLVGCNPGMMEVLLHQAFCFGPSVLAVASDQGHGHNVPPPLKNTHKQIVYLMRRKHAFVWEDLDIYCSLILIGSV